jgi:hypothetical protein
MNILWRKTDPGALKLQQEIPSVDFVCILDLYSNFKIRQKIGYAFVDQKYIFYLNSATCFGLVERLQGYQLIQQECPSYNYIFR